jgi:hypothetical protein
MARESSVGGRMSTSKTYFIVPRDDFPEDGPIKLGNIIYKPTEPDESINVEELVEIPPNSKQSIHHYDWCQTIESIRDGRAGVLARYLDILGLGGNFGMSFGTTKVDQYRFRDLETICFTPSQAYVEDAVSKPGVRRFVENVRYAPVYMVTGLKIARGPDSQVMSRKSMIREGRANLSLPGVIGFSPIAFDAGDMSFRQSSSTNTSFGGSSDFVFAYRLGKITFCNNFGDYPVPKLQKFREGAMLAAGQDRDVDDSTVRINAQVTYEGEEAVAEDLSNQDTVTAIDEDDNTKCRCFIVPQK